MKFKLMTALIASLTMVSCNNDKVDKSTDDSDAGAQVAEAAPSVEATPSKVSASIAPVAQKFDGEKYAPTELAHNTDYFIIYFTASW